MAKNFIRLFGAVWFVVLLTLSAVSQQRAPQTAESVDVTSPMHYLLHLPSGYQEESNNKSWPLMVFLHGSGERGDDLELVKKWGPPKLIESQQKLPFIVVSPQCPAGTFWNLEHLNQLIESVVNKYRVDKTRIYLTGLSMGGHGVWALAALYPEKFAAVAPICGYGDPEFADQLLDIPIWAFHGDADDVVPPSGSSEIVAAIKAKGGTKTKLTIYPGVGHNSWSQTYADRGLFKWFLKHKRVSK